MPVRDAFVLDGDVPLAVRVHQPADGDTEPAAGNGRSPAVVVTGSWLTVKEQMADLYAAHLAAAGYVAVTFDSAGFGASRGTPRQTEVPLRKVSNLRAVVQDLRWSSGIDPDRIGVLGVGAGAQYALGALGRGLPVAAFVSVAGWFHDLASVAALHGGAAGLARRLDRAEQATRAFQRYGRLSLVPAYAPGDDRAGMSVPLDYYADPARGAVPSWRNEMSEMSWAPWLTYDAFAAVGAVQVPALFVHSDDAVLPGSVRRIAGELGYRASLSWTDGAQTDFYDRPDQVDLAVKAAIDHFGAHLSSRTPGRR